MDRQRSFDSDEGSTPDTRFPLTRHARSSSASTVMLKKNMQAKAAALRLANMMASNSGSCDDEDEDEEDMMAVEHSSTGLGLSAGRAHRPRPSVPVRATSEHLPSARMLSPGVRPSLSIRTKEQPSVGSATSSPQPANSAEQPLSSHAILTTPGKSPMGTSPLEQPPCVRIATGRRPHVSMKLGTLVPPSANNAFRQANLLSPEVSGESQQDRRSSMEGVNVDFRVPKEHTYDLESRDSSVLQDEFDMLQEDNEHLLDKLRLAEQRCEEADARAKQLENQVAALGEGVSLEARLLSRKEEALKKREAELRVATNLNGCKSGGMTTLQMEAGTTKGEATSALEKLQESEFELRSLRCAVQRLVLTQEEMEEVVLKRCWLSRYWGLCVQYGIHPDIAEAKHGYWSSWAPLPYEVVVAAGEDAKEDSEPANCDLGEREHIIRDVHNIKGENNAESMILVDKGLRELASLKVEDAVLLEMGQRRKRYLQKAAFSGFGRIRSFYRTELSDADNTRSITEQHKLFDSFELSPEEAEDVQFKLAWLIYFWRRAKSHGLEDDIAEDRLRTWISQCSHQLTTHDAIDVERGMTELRKLGIETSLWEESRSWIE